jgi:integrase
MRRTLAGTLWWKQELGSLLLAQIRPSLIAEKRDELLAGFTSSGRLRSPSTVVRYLSSLSHVFSKAVKEWEWVRENPVLKIEKPRQSQGRRRVLDEIEQKSLLKACEESGSKDLFLIVAIALGTGMRKGEIMSLCWKDINLNLSEGKGIIFLENAKKWETKTGSYNGTFTGAIAEQTYKPSGDSLLFPSPNCSNRPIDIRSAWECALKKAGIEGFVFHGLRHQTASCAATICG